MSLGRTHRGHPERSASEAKDLGGENLRLWTKRLGIALCLLALALPATGQSRSPVFPDIGYDQLVGRRLPLATPLRDESGAAVRFGELLAGRPAVLVFAYYHCPMLCPVVLDGFAGSLAAVGLDAGRDFEVVVVSFDPHETPAQAAAMKRKILGDYGRPAAGWHFTTAAAPAIAALTRAAGFRYQPLPESDQYAHAAGFVVLTPEGRIARYLFGLEPAPRDLRLALVEAGRGRIGSVVDQVLLYCFHYDPATGRYSATILNLVRLAAAATVLGLAVLVVTLRRRETAPALPPPPALEAVDR